MIHEKKPLKALVRQNTADTVSYSYIRMDKNERLLPFCNDFVDQIQKVVSEDLIMAYPTAINEFQKELALWLGLDENQLQLSSGSDQGIKTIFETFIQEGDQILLNKPSFAMYSVYAKMFGAQIKEVPCRSDLTLDFEKIKSYINNDLKMLAIENPNGFVGTKPNSTDVMEVLDLAEENEVLVVIDEAYYHFCEQTFSPLIQKYSNLIVTRTFSKAIGLAGLRLGYLLSNPEIISKLNKVKNPFEVTGVTAAIAQIMLKHSSYYEDYLAMVESNRSYFLEKLKDVSIHGYNTETNFILVQIPKGINHSSLLEFMKERGILVRRPFEESFLEGLMRVAIGTRSHIDLFVKHLSGYIQLNGV